MIWRFVCPQRIAVPSRAGQTIISYVPMAWYCIIRTRYILVQAFRIIGVQTNIGYRTESLSFDMSKCRTFDVWYVSSVFCPPFPVIILVPFTQILNGILIFDFIGYRNRIEYDCCFFCFIDIVSKWITVSISDIQHYRIHTSLTPLLLMARACFGWPMLYTR